MMDASHNTFWTPKSRPDTSEWKFTWYEMEQKNINALIHKIADKNNSGCSGNCQFKQLHWIVKQEYTYQWKLNIFAK